MNQYDIALKNLFQRQLQTGFLARLTGLQITEWLPTELPEVRTRHVDLLGRAASGDLVHIEFQSRNHSRMALRMAEYALAICHRHGSLPQQVVIYVGDRPLRMESRLEGGGMAYRCQILDIREIPTEALLASPHIEDNILAVLTRLADSRETIREILQRIQASDKEGRAVLLAEMLLLAGLRQLEVIMKGEIDRMSVLIDINRHTIFGPVHREGVREGRAQGAQDQTLKFLAGRFGVIPKDRQRQVRSMTPEQLDALSSRIFDVSTLDELLPALAD